MPIVVLRWDNVLAQHSWDFEFTMESQVCPSAGFGHLQEWCLAGVQRKDLDQKEHEALSADGWAVYELSLCWGKDAISTVQLFEMGESAVEGFGDQGEAWLN